MKNKNTAVFFILVLTFVFSFQTHGATRPLLTPIKVACIGDSITEGSGTSDHALFSYPAQLQKLLGQHYQVRNFGLGGRTMLKKGDMPYWNEATFAESKNWQPDIVIIQLGTNDSKSWNWVYKNEFLSDYKDMINQYKSLASAPNIFVAQPPVVYGDGAFGITNPVVRDEVAPLVQQAANDTGVTLIDNYTATQNMAGNFPDTVHPNNTGAFAIAYNTYKSLGSPDARVSFFADANYSGLSFSFPQGHYSGDMMLASGLPNDWMSSLQVNSSTLVNVFENGDFSGEKTTYMESRAWIGSDQNDRMSSFDVHSTGPSNIYSEAADRLQSAAHQTYISPTGFYYTHGPDNGWDFWWNANALSTLTDGYLRTRSDTYKTRMKNLLHGIREKHGAYTNHFYDDMLWLALSAVKAYKATADQEYLDVAQLLWSDILTGRSPEYDGAISWNKGCHPACKNAISNSPAALLGAKLYRITGNTQQLQYAEQIHAFVKNTLISPTGGVYDGKDVVTGVTNTNPDWIFSYNVGQYLEASLELFQVTGNSNYLDDAIKTAEHAFNERMVDGVFYTNETGQGDGGLFKGIFIRGLLKLAREGNLDPETRQRYYDAIKYNAIILIKQGFNSDGLIGPVWNRVPSADLELHFSTQLSGIMLLEAAASADQIIIYQDINFGGNATHLSPSTYATSDLQWRGAKDNDLTSLAIPPGFQANLWDNNHFTGDLYSAQNTLG